MKISRKIKKNILHQQHRADYIYIYIYISAQPIKHVTPDAKPGKQITYIEIAHTTISNTITFKEDLFNSRRKAYTKTNSRNNNI